MRALQSRRRILTSPQSSAWVSHLTGPFLRCLVKFASYYEPYRSCCRDLLATTHSPVNWCNQGRGHVMGRFHRCKIHPRQVAGVDEAVRQLLRALLLPRRKSGKRDSPGELACHFVSAENFNVYFLQYTRRISSFNFFQIE